jgi:hypothetical protein
MKDILSLLLISDFYGASKTIDIAKGKYKIPSTTKEGMQLLKRIWKSK